MIHQLLQTLKPLDILLAQSRFSSNKTNAVGEINTIGFLCQLISSTNSSDDRTCFLEILTAYIYIYITRSVSLLNSHSNNTTALEETGSVGFLSADQFH